MKVQLAASSHFLSEVAQLDYVSGVSGEANDVVDVDDATGRRLLSEGMARVPDRTPTTHADLDAEAAATGVDLSGARTAAQKRAAIQAARKES